MSKVKKHATDKVVKLQGKEYVLFEGLLEVGHNEYNLVGIETEMLQIPNKENEYTAITQAVVKAKGEDGEIQIYSGLGDASPKSVGKMIQSHIIRMSETRAIGRALRFLTGFGTVFEELGEIEKEETKKKEKKQEKKQEEKTSSNKSLASQAQLNKIEKDAKALGLSASDVYKHLGIDSEEVSKTDASKTIKFLKTDEAKGLQEKSPKGAEDGTIDIQDDDLPF
jgi:hypothetical protein